MNAITRGVVAAAAALPLMALPACGGDEDNPQWTTPCAVVLDGSGSGTKLDVEGLMKERLGEFLVDKHCGAVAFAPITGSSGSSKCDIDSVVLDQAHQPGDDVAANRADALDVALEGAATMLACAQKDEYKASDILGGIDRAVGGRPPGDGVYEMLVISDFAQTDATMNLYKEKLDDKQRREELIAELKADARVPNLSGTQITAYGFGKGFSKVPGRTNLLLAFWNELITGAGGPVLDLRGQKLDQ
ncbi:hypothetical protein ACIBG8_41585 [Nonomuraea sp. NPDC050556]|uniref:hypothetical protein n=1 Tax=Nonomuraea sp. NPDC050556 TaxID=3364369 RepID=UPI00378C5006